MMWAGPANGYEILLDIDLDGNPATLNTYSLEDTVTVRIVLKPTQPAEEIQHLEFGLGGTCWECEGVFDYGTAFDLLPLDFGDWTDHPDFTGTWGGATCSLCCGNPGFHFLYEASPIEGTFVLEEPIFLATFHAWKDEPMWGSCPVPPSNLAAFSLAAPGEFWNYLQIGGDAPIPVAHTTWGAIKAQFRP
jgi:hypothetical protein